jgi:hypothetical protein
LGKSVLKKTSKISNPNKIRNGSQRTSMIAVFNVIDFSTLSSKKVTFGFKLAQIHQKLIVRAAL